MITLSKQYLLITSKIIVFLLFLGCSSSEKVLEVNQLKSESPIYILYNKEDEAIKIQIPFLFKLTNKSSKDVSFSSLEYKDFFTSAISASVLYINSNDTLVLIEKSGYKSIKSKKSMFVTLYTQHYLDKNERKKFNDSKKTLGKKQIIKNVDSFYKKNEELLTMLSYNDSIYVRTQQDNNIKTLSFPLKTNLK